PGEVAVMAGEAEGVVARIEGSGEHGGIATAPVVHGAVRDGDCSACHSVHGGQHARLLRAVDPAVLTTPFDARNYALCFSCHDSDLAREPNATLFRDGQVNLHQTHLRSGDTSGSCRDCHAVHAGNQPRLIADTVDYQDSGWVTPMGFVLTEDGGSCAPGCHEPLSYSRRADPASPPQTGGSP
ncbi:MAG: cytochrome c3 family protein, partial [Phycisphaerales bacterium JB039]